MTTRTLDVEANIKQWGNGLAVRINKAVADVAGFADGTPVRIHAERGRVVIETSPRRLTLNEMLASFDPVRHGGEAMAFTQIGAEII
jgi:antitoxin MazE